MKINRSACMQGSCILHIRCRKNQSRSPLPPLLPNTGKYSIRKKNNQPINNRMKKYFLFLLSGFMALAASAQAKFGHINSLKILQAMPEMAAVKFSLDSFGVELQKEYQERLTEYQDLV